MNRDEILKVLDGMIEYQDQKVLQIARQFDPALTPEDIRNPQDYPFLATNQRFNFEDGILSGYKSVRIALLAEWNRLEG